MRTLVSATVLAAAFTAPALARPLTIEDVTMLSRIGAPTASKDGRWLIWAQRETDLAADKGRYDLWRLDLSRRDFRIPYTQGIATFTVLQRRDIPSRLVVFPNENHWVLRPKNSRQWYREVLGWMDKWTSPNP